MSLSRAKKQATHYTALLVFTMGVVSMFSLLDRPSDFNLHAQNAIGARSPANIGAAPAAFERQTEVVDLDCHKKAFTLSAISQVRLRGRVCKANDSEKLKTSDIRNAATGMVATVFRTPESNSFTTDYIQLKSGLNMITIENELENGNTESQQIAITVQ